MPDVFATPSGWLLAPVPNRMALSSASAAELAKAVRSTASRFSASSKSSRETRVMSAQLLR